MKLEEHPDEFFQTPQVCEIYKKIIERDAK
jgi:hypothetical protein